MTSYKSERTRFENVSVIYSSFMGGALSHRQHYNSYSLHNVTPCSKTRCCVVLPGQHENKHKQEGLPMVKSLESTEDF